MGHPPQPLPDSLDSSGLEAAVAGDERKTKVEGGCRDDAVGHVGNNVAGNGSQGASDVVIERKDFECGIVLAQ